MQAGTVHGPKQVIQSCLRLQVPPTRAAAAPGQDTIKAAKPKLDPRDFMFTGLRGETRVKLPG